MILKYDIDAMRIIARCKSPFVAVCFASMHWNGAYIGVRDGSNNWKDEYKRRMFGNDLP